MTDTWDLAPDDGAAFRTVLGHFATGIALVTAVDGEPVGMACNSFSSVSLDPPLVLFCAAKSSGTWPRIQRAGAWCANFVAADGEQLVRRFATPGADRFSQTGWKPGVTGAPVLSDAISYVECLTDAEHDAGDHVIVVGRVQRMGYVADAAPLLFYRGGYGRFAS